MSRPDVAVGDRLEPLVIERVAAERTITMAAVLDDPVPIHFDVEAVRRLGLGDRLVNQGPMCIGYVTELLVRFAGDPAAVRRLRCRLLDQIYVGERVVCEGEVSSVDHAAGTAEIAVRVSADGRPVAQGDGVVAVGG